MRLCHLGLYWFKLASPAVFKQVYNQGPEQLIFCVTMMVTLYTNLLVGLLTGLTLVMITHMLLAKVPIAQFLKMIYSSGSQLEEKPENTYDLNIKGIANFLGILQIDKLVKDSVRGSCKY